MVLTTNQKLYFSNNETVAVVQPPQEAKQALSGSVASLMSKNEDLKSLTVIFNFSPLGLVPGDSVFLKPESYSAPYMNVPYQINGVKFVLIPKDAVIAMVKSAAGV